MLFTKTYTYGDFLQYLNTTDNRLGQTTNFYFYDDPSTYDRRPKHIREAERKYGKLDEAFV